MRRALIVAIFIQASVPITDDAQAVGELLRAAAVKAGCTQPGVSMRYPDEERQLTIEVRCLEPQDHDPVTTEETTR